MRRSNNNANMTMFPGEALGSQPYIQVNWPWVTLPIFSTFLSAILVVVTIVLTRPEPLLKGSATSLLMQRLDGWEDDVVKMMPTDTAHGSNYRSREMVARLERDAEGHILVKRVD